METQCTHACRNCRAESLITARAAMSVRSTCYVCKVHKETPNHILYGGAEAPVSSIALSFAFVLVVIINVGGGTVWYPSMCMKVGLCGINFVSHAACA